MSMNQSGLRKGHLSEVLGDALLRWMKKLPQLCLSGVHFFPKRYVSYKLVCILCIMLV